MTNYQGVVQLKDINQTQHRKFLRKVDLDEELVVTITRVEKEDVSRDGEHRQEKFVAYFAEIEQALILKWNLAEAIKSVTGFNDMDLWSGQQIVLFNDPSVRYEGQIVGGVRVKAVNT